MKYISYVLAFLVLVSITHISTGGWEYFDNKNIRGMVIIITSLVLECIPLYFIFKIKNTFLKFLLSGLSIGIVSFAILFFIGIINPPIPHSPTLARVKADVQKINALQELFYTKHHRYATSTDDLSRITPPNYLPIPPKSNSLIRYYTNEKESCAFVKGDNKLGLNPNPYCIVQIQKEEF